MEKSAQFRFNMFLAIAGLALGAVFYFFPGGLKLSVVFIAVSIATILHQFLGGIGDQNSFQLGAIKLAGSAAVLAAFIWLLNSVVLTAESSLEISPDDWIPINATTGAVESVEISFGDSTLRYPLDDSVAFEQRKRHEFRISRRTLNELSLEPRSRRSDTAGIVELSSFEGTGLFNELDISTDQRRVEVLTLYLDDESRNSSYDSTINSGLPFEIVVHSSCKFSIVADYDSATYYANRPLEQKTCYLVNGEQDNETYVVFLEQAFCRVAPDTLRYAKWLIRKLKHSINTYQLRN